jgi:hypothetical protein
MDESPDLVADARRFARGPLREHLAASQVLFRRLADALEATRTERDYWQRRYETQYATLQFAEARVRQLEEALKRMCEPKSDDDAVFMVGPWEEIGKDCIEIAREVLASKEKIPAEEERVDQISEMVARMQTELHDWAQKYVVGRPVGERLFVTIKHTMEQRMNDALPEGVTATLINPRLSATKFEADGWLVDNSRREKL